MPHLFDQMPCSSPQATNHFHDALITSRVKLILEMLSKCIIKGNLHVTTWITYRNQCKAICTTLKLSGSFAATPSKSIAWSLRLRKMKSDNKYTVIYTYVTFIEGLDLSSLKINGILNEEMEEVSISGIPAIQNCTTSSWSLSVSMSRGNWAGRWL